MIKSNSFFVSRLLMLLFLVMTTVSCENTDSPQLSDGVPTGEHIKYRYSGTDYVLSNPVTIDGTNKKIDAFDGSGSSLNAITLYMPSDVTPGTYFVTANPSDDDTYGIYFTLASNGIDILADSGIITVTSVTPDNIQGTFNFSGMNGSVPVNVTHGSFSADY